jgi:GntR family transcriptional regulator of arabinose operon
MRANTKDLAKHRKVRDAIVDSIRTGEIKQYERLPAERELAKQHNVSYMTARRAVTEMVEEGLLERRGREGTYVRPYGASRLSTTTLHVICHEFDTSDIKAFLRLSVRECEKRGWKHHSIRFSPSNERVAIRAMQEKDELTLVLGIGLDLKGALGDAMQKANGRVVLIGNRLDEVGVPSVLADDAQAIRLAMQRLHEAGHTKIAMVSDRPSYAIDRVQIATWRSALGPLANTSHKNLIVVNTAPHASKIESTCASVKAYYESGGDATAIITLRDEMAVATLYACRMLGRSVPEHVSLINSGNSSLMGVTHPTVTCIDVRLDSHIEQAMQFLENALAGTLSPTDKLRLIDPHLVERESVRNL